MIMIIFFEIHIPKYIRVLIIHFAFITKPYFTTANRLPITLVKHPGFAHIVGPAKQHL